MSALLIVENAGGTISLRQGRKVVEVIDPDHASHRKRHIVAVGSAMFAVLSVAASASSTTSRVIGRSSASGGYAVTIASGSTKHPLTIKVRVLARPNQHVSVNWTLVCSRGFGAGSKSGSFSSGTPATRAVRFPMRHPERCTVRAGAQLKRSGRVTVILIAVR